MCMFVYIYLHMYVLPIKQKININKLAKLSEY